MISDPWRGLKLGVIPSCSCDAFLNWRLIIRIIYSNLHQISNMIGLFIENTERIIYNTLSARSVYRPSSKQEYITYWSTNNKSDEINHMLYSFMRLWTRWWKWDFDFSSWHSHHNIPSRTILAQEHSLVWHECVLGWC